MKFQETPLAGAFIITMEIKQDELFIAGSIGWRNGGRTDLRERLRPSRGQKPGWYDRRLGRSAA